MHPTMGALSATSTGASRCESAGAWRRRSRRRCQPRRPIAHRSSHAGQRVHSVRPLTETTPSDLDRVGKLVSLVELDITRAEVAPGEDELGRARPLVSQYPFTQTGELVANQRRHSITYMAVHIDQSTGEYVVLWKTLQDRHLANCT